MNIPECKVFVKCMTFNQANYITDTMNGFIIQKTDFPFLCAIIDDASTDGEQQVIIDYIIDNFDVETMQEETEYGYITFARHKTNKNCYFGVLFLKENHYTRWALKESYIKSWWQSASYFAICEGDDYWIEPMKLQKQVDILDETPNCGLVRTDVNRYFQSSGRIEYNLFGNVLKNSNQNSFDDFIMKGWFAAPCTWLFRKSLKENVPILSKNCFEGDILFLLHVSEFNEIFFMNSSTAIYRVLEESESHSRDINKIYQFTIKVKNTRLHYAKHKDFKFRMSFWWQVCVMSMRPSLRKQFFYIPSWICGSVIDFLSLLYRDSREID